MQMAAEAHLSRCGWNTTLKQRLLQLQLLLRVLRKQQQ
jgi:hypothetical protein